MRVHVMAKKRRDKSSEAKKFSVSMNVRRSILQCLFLALGLLISSYSVLYAEYRTIVSLPVKYTEIGPGVRHELHQIFTDEGWIVVNLVRSSMNPAETVVPLYPVPLSSPAVLTNLAETEGDVLVAINGDYFDYGAKAVLGRIVDQGVVVQTSNNDHRFGNFSISKDGFASVGYEGPHKNVLSSGSASMNIDFVNKPYAVENSLLIFDSAFGWETPLIPGSMVVQMIVEGGVITTVQQLNIPLAIPAGRASNGSCVIRASGAKATELLMKFKAGMSVNIVLDESAYTSISGGAQLVKDGVALTTFSHDLAGNHPRTVLGVEKDGKTMIFATVNGRTTSFRGINQSELASLMVELGAYNALILDGGGSTEMIVGNPFKGGTEIVSHLSDGNERKVYNGLAIKYRPVPTGVPYQIRFQEEAFQSVVGLPLPLKMEAIDTGYSNYVPEGVEYEAIGIRGEFLGDYFIPSESGEGVIVAKLGELKAYADVLVSDDVSRLSVEQSGNHYTFYGITSDGNKVWIPSFLIHAYISDNIAVYDGNTGTVIPQKEDVMGFITFTYYLSDRDLVSKSLPLRFGKPVVILENFDTASDLPQVIMSEVPGRGKILCLEYGSNNSLEFPKPVIIPKGTSKISMDIFSNGNTRAGINAVLKNSRGDLLVKPFVSNVDWYGWKTHTLSLDSSEGFQLESLVVVSGGISGTVCVDHITYVAESSDGIFIPMDIDNKSKVSDYKITGGAERVRVGYANGNLTEKRSLSPYLYDLGGRFQYLEIENTGGLIRSSSGYDQWKTILDTLRNAEKPVIIRFSGTYYFRDKLERKLLFQELSNCNYPVILVFKAYLGQTDIFKHRGIDVIEIKEDEVLEISEEMEFQISPPGISFE